MDPDVLEQVGGESLADRLVRALTLMTDCSATVDPDRYERTILRPVDRTPVMRVAYFQNSCLSTCQLAQCAAWRMAGVPDPEVTAHEPLDGGISGRQRRLCERYGAWVDVGTNLDAQALAALLTRGRGWWIDDGTGMDVHAGSCVTDAIVVGAMTIAVDTVEGGQFKVHDADPHEHPIGTTAQRRFTRTLTRDVSGRWKMGARHIIAVQLADKLPIPVTAASASGENVTPNAGDDVAPAAVAEDP